MHFVTRHLAARPKETSTPADARGHSTTANGNDMACNNEAHYSLHLDNSSTQQGSNCVIVSLTRTASLTPLGSHYRSRIPPY
jgi:hypothetical protein